MISHKRPDLVIAIYFQLRGFAFVLLENGCNPVAWGAPEFRGANTEVRCLNRIDSLLALHTPDVLVLQDMSERGTRRAPRMQELNRHAIELAHQRGIPVRMYSRPQMLQCLEKDGRVTKQRRAETIAQHIPPLSWLVPPPRKLWNGWDVRIGIFEAAALAWTYFYTNDGQQEAA
jgi:hypothetical protein